MPIRPENKHRYPKEWSTVIVPRIRARSSNRCECTGQCGLPHGFERGARCLAWHNEIGFWDDFDWKVHRPLLHGRRDVIKIVLTVAHLDHKPENCADANLLHLCQRCHNRLDGSHRRIRARARAQRASGDLFEAKETS